MGEKPKHHRKFPAGAKYLIATMADTTWRMFVPTVGGLLLGLWLDQTINTMPWFTLIGLVIGTIITIQLVRNQLKRGRVNKGLVDVK